MCVPKRADWVDSLRIAMSRLYEPTTRQPLPWFLSGEAALALQGVDVEPQVIEFRAISPFAVAYFSGFMKSYEDPANSATVIYRKGGTTPPGESWRSNVHQPVVAWSGPQRQFWYGRWNVGSMPVQVYYARGGEETDPISRIKAGDLRRVHFEGELVPVVPLEVLLAESALHDRTPTTNRILHALRSAGYSQEMLTRALDILPYDRAARLLRLLEIRLVAG